MDPAVQLVVPAATVIALFTLGLTLDVGSLTSVLTRPAGLLLGLAVAWLLLPCAAVAMCLAVRPAPPIALGTLVIAACPVATPAALFARVGDGDAMLALALTVVTSLASAVTLPLAVAIGASLVGGDAATGLHVGRAVAGITAVATLPTAAGMALRRARPALAAAIEPRVTPFLLALLLVVFVAAVASQRASILPSLADAGLLALGLNLAAVGTAWPLARVARLPPPQAVAVALGAGLRNFALAAFVALTLLGDPSLLAPAIAYALLMWPSAVVVAGHGRRRAAAARARSVSTAWR